ncbi:MAG: KH domain-containing protein [Acidobacteriota bacterium]|jgi:predicted RNA-binding protein YlqC (UPF0109 family)|nr:KH domain-containing protein [Bryobacteraceae bacterium CoA2 C42]MCA2963340.1 KH domain-containing protein [Acidobacteriaceae bacterium]
MAAALKDLVEGIARSIVDHPAEVLVTETGGDQVITLALRVAPADLGRVIGKQGRTARSMRTLLTAAALKANRRVNLEIVEDR